MTSVNILSNFILDRNTSISKITTAHLNGFKISHALSIPEKLCYLIKTISLAALTIFTAFLAYWTISSMIRKLKDSWVKPDPTKQTSNSLTDISKGKESRSNIIKETCPASLAVSTKQETHLPNNGSKSGTNHPITHTATPDVQPPTIKLPAKQEPLASSNVSNNTTPHTSIPEVQTSPTKPPAKKVADPSKSPLEIEYSKLTSESLFPKLIIPFKPEDYLINFSTRTSGSHAVTVVSRYGNVLCPKDTAICVNGQYLHANQVGKNIGSKSFICSQAPIARPVQEPALRLLLPKATNHLFWSAIIQEKVTTIIDLTTSEDTDVEPYYPVTTGIYSVKGDERSEEISITLEKTEQIEKMNVSAYKVKKGEKIHTIVRKHINNWKDFGTVGIPLLDKIVELLSINTGEILIHCRAGIGRTGTAITAFFLKEKIMNQEITNMNFETSLVELIKQLRAQRNLGFVQTPDQFNLLRLYGRHLLDTLAKKESGTH